MGLSRSTCFPRVSPDSGLAQSSRMYSLAFSSSAGVGEWRGTGGGVLGGGGGDDEDGCGGALGVDGPLFLVEGMMDGVARGRK